MNEQPFDPANVKKRLIVEQPFWGTCAYHLVWKPDTSIETLRTDGTYVRFNPAYMQSRTANEQLFCAAHETGHNTFGHLWRRGDRDPAEWNTACDYALNLHLVDAGFIAPAGVLLDERFRGMSAEQIYSLRAKEKAQSQPQPEPEPDPEPEPEDEDEDEEIDQESEDAPESESDQPGGDEDDDDSQDGDEPGDEDSEGDGDEPGDEDGDPQDDGGEADGDGEGDGEGGEGEGAGNGPPSLMPGCPTGDFVDAPIAEPGDEGPAPLTEADWQGIAAEAETISDKAGLLPGFLKRAIDASREAQVDWKAELQDFMTNTVASDETSFARPNRRFIHSGLYLPGVVKENVGPIVFGVDVSGSITQDMLNVCAAEFNGLLRDAKPERVYVVYCDCAICGVEEFAPDEDVVLKLPDNGGGGTAFQPLFDLVETEGWDPEAVVYFSDLYGDRPKEPSYPVLWLTPMHSREVAPFGRIIQIP